MTPEFRVMAGLRRVTEQQLQPLRQLKVPVTPEIVEKYKWDAFWDAPLNTDKVENTRDNAIPPPGGVAGQPGLPRSAEEITRASATYRATSCEVASSGARLMVTFPGVTIGPFDGRLQYTVFKGSNLIAQEVIAKTEKPSVAYKYEAGLKGLPISASSRVVWRDMANTWQDYRFGGAPNTGPVTLKASNRLVVSENGEGSIAAASSGLARRRTTSGTCGIGKTPRLPAAQARRLRSACASRTTRRTRPRPAAVTRTRVRILRCAARDPARGSIWPSICT
jgi:hypothetical protein